jgi:hypothetical protein
VHIQPIRIIYSFWRESEKQAFLFMLLGFQAAMASQLIICGFTDFFLHNFLLSDHEYTEYNEDMAEYPQMKIETSPWIKRKYRCRDAFHAR